MKKKAIIMVADGLPKVFKDKRMIQKVLFLFRASPFAPVRGGKYLESELSDIRRHTPSRLPDGRLKRNKIKKPPLAVKKSPAVRRNKNSYLRRPNPTTSPSPRPSPRGGSPILLWIRTL